MIGQAAFGEHLRVQSTDGKGKPNGTLYEPTLCCTRVPADMRNQGLTCLTHQASFASTTIGFTW